MKGAGETLSIRKAAEATGLSVHTLRYYEREGLLPGVARNGAGHRRYDPQQVRWLGLLDRLRVSGMSIARMRRYVELARQGDGTRDQRRALLEIHEADILTRMEELQRCLAIVRAKIETYDGRRTALETVWRLVEEARTDVSEAHARGLRGPASASGRADARRPRQGAR